MRTIFIIILFIFSIKAAYSQNLVSIIFDANHLNIINENGALRYSTETYHNTLQENIKARTQDISTNLSAVVLVQGIIHQSLTQVDKALKSSRAVLNISSLTQDIYSQSAQLLETAQTEPWLLLIAEQTTRAFKQRSVKLALEVSEFILKEGNDILMDYEKRDYLLAKITLELSVIRALVFSMHRSIYWSKVNGIIRTINPYQGFINSDKQKANEILRYYNILK